MPHLIVHGSESVTRMAAPEDVLDTVFGQIVEGRTTEQKQALSTAVVQALTTLLPAVEIVSMNVSDFERETYRSATMVKPDDVAG